jgi:hypothetical protein
MKMTALVFIVVALCSIGIVTIIFNPKSRSNLWLGIMALAPGLGVLVVFVSFLLSETISKTVSPLAIDCLFMVALYVSKAPRIPGPRFCLPFPWRGLAGPNNLFARLPMNEAGKIKIILVEDDPSWQKIMADFLGECPDFEVVGTAGRKEEALEFALNISVDIVLMDINLTENKRDGIA